MRSLLFLWKLQAEKIIKNFRVTHKWHFKTYLHWSVHIGVNMLNFWHSPLTALLPSCMSVIAFSHLLHSLFEPWRLHTNKRRCVCMVRPLIGQSWLSCLKRGSVGHKKLPWSPNISMSLFSPGTAPVVCVSNLQACVTPAHFAPSAVNVGLYCLSGDNNVQKVLENKLNV